MRSAVCFCLLTLTNLESIHQGAILLYNQPFKPSAESQDKVQDNLCLLWLMKVSDLWAMSSVWLIADDMSLVALGEFSHRSKFSENTLKY